MLEPGAPVLPEWDPETGVVIVVPPSKLRPGTHRVRIVVTDAVGNRSEHAQSFQLP